MAAVVAMSAVLPGSGHISVGRRRTGEWIMGVFLVLVAAAVAALVAGLSAPETLAAYAVQPQVLDVVRWASLLGGAAWIAVILSAATLTRPGSATLGSKVVVGVVTASLCAAVAVPTVTLSQYAGTTSTVIEDIFQEFQPQAGAPEPPTPEEILGDGRINLMLVGADSDARDELRTGLRADTVIVASVEVSTGRALLFSLPRNMQQIPFPPDTVMGEQFPDGFDCGVDCMLNAIPTWVADHPDLFEGQPDPAMGALRDGVGEALGLDIEYHVLVNLEGFEKIIDALGGVTIRPDRRLPIGGLDAYGNRVTPSGYIEAELQDMSGFTALWYARSRADSTTGDYERIARQRCLMGAIVREANPGNLLVNYNTVAQSAPGAVETDLPPNILPALVRVGFRTKDQPVESLAFIPPLVPDTADPDFTEIRRIVAEAVAASEARPDDDEPASAAPTPPAPAPTAPDTGEEPVPEQTPPADQPVNLEDVCAYE